MRLLSSPGEEMCIPALKKVKKPHSNFSRLHVCGTLENCPAKKAIKENSVLIQEECK